MNVSEHGDHRLWPCSALPTESVAMAFADRSDAGRRLADRLRHLRSENVVVVGLPRGGVPVAAEVARALGAPLDVIVVRRLRLPFQPELGMGAIGQDGVRIINEEIVRVAAVSANELAAVEARERVELERRARRYRGGRARLPLCGRTVIVVDDGVATGSTARAACQVVRAQGGARLVLAIPVASPHPIAMLEQDADELVCLQTPATFAAIGQWYADFAPVSDGAVADCLRQTTERVPSTRATGVVLPTREEEVEVRAGRVRLAGRLTVPEGACGFVVLALAGGSSRHSPRNRLIATALNRSGLGTVLLDLLSVQEEVDRSNVFDIELLARRLAGATGVMRERPKMGGLPIGYLGTETGAAAALWAAAEPDADVPAVVSCGGRPDLAIPRLTGVTAPVLLIVGDLDQVVLTLNRQAQARLRGENRLAVVPDATHLFEEPGALEAAAGFAREWFIDHLAPMPQPARGT
ncbi:phosphoribosyltransferase family protein [Actinoallomurus oryzae]|uniref:Phosphoribosyltransferase family protein n=1 Tax=Actinoallomurus oryzae TaxID=502180 RepID=A0ABP8QTQ8_9ACTN